MDTNLSAHSFEYHLCHYGQGSEDSTGEVACLGIGYTALWQMNVCADCFIVIVQ